jgi:hypothetical protein
MNFLTEMQEKGISEVNAIPDIYCKVFKDNSGALELARVPKMRPRMKHINIAMHHFRSYVRMRLIHVIPIKSEDQPAEILNKSVEQNVFLKHRKFLLGW